MIKLSIEITSPLAAEDRDLLSGIAVMTLAIANHEMAKERFPETFKDDDEPAETGLAPMPTPCAFLDPDDGTRICIGDAGHRGRHRFRAMPTGPAEAPEGGGGEGAGGAGSKGSTAFRPN